MSSQHHGRGRPPSRGVGDPDLSHPVPASSGEETHDDSAPGDGVPDEDVPDGMSDGVSDEDVPDEGVLIREIETHFPGWGVWRSDTRRWWAFRTSAHPLTIDQLRAGCRLIVQADTAPGLRAAIRAANDCARRVA